MEPNVTWMERKITITSNEGRVIKLPRKLKKQYKSRIIRAAKLSVSSRRLRIYTIYSIEGDKKKTFGYTTINKQKS